MPTPNATSAPQTQNQTPRPMFCTRPLGTSIPLYAITWEMLERAAYGGEEIGPHHDGPDGHCVYCGA
jgi:hypothetical protein